MPPPKVTAKAPQEWLILYDKVERGPYDQDSIEQLIACEIISPPDCQISRSTGERSWTPLHQHPLFARRLKKKPSPRSSDAKPRDPEISGIPPASLSSDQSEEIQAPAPKLHPLSFFLLNIATPTLKGATRALAGIAVARIYWLEPQISQVAFAACAALVLLSAIAFLKDRYPSHLADRNGITVLATRIGLGLTLSTLFALHFLPSPEPSQAATAHAPKAPAEELRPLLELGQRLNANLTRVTGEEIARIGNLLARVAGSTSSPWGSVPNRAEFEAASHLGILALIASLSLLVYANRGPAPIRQTRRHAGLLLLCLTLCHVGSQVAFGLPAILLVSATAIGGAFHAQRLLIP